jgi:hypothetical protein
VAKKISATVPAATPTEKNQRATSWPAPTLGFRLQADQRFV